MKTDKSVHQYTLNQPEFMLEADLAGEFPVYLYLSDDKKTLLYGRSVTDLLNDARVPKPLKISNEGLSFLLQSGVVPPPKTVYESIYILGIGDKAWANTSNGKIELQFSHKFPFMNAKRLPASEIQPDEDYILQLLAEATISRLDTSRPSFLFHSAGKDSNSIALALAEAGWQNKVTLITHKSKGEADESVISEKIAKHLGFRHEVLHEVDKLEASHQKAINNYFVHAPFPCTDDITLAYPLYSYQLPELRCANIIDGMGNDVFMGHIPSQSEFSRQKFANYIPFIRSLSKYFPSEGRIHIPARARAEWTGLSGLSFSDTKKILNNCYDVSNFWIAKDEMQDYLDFRASIRGVILDQEIFSRKARNFADSISANIVLPWANEKIAEYFSAIPEEYMFDRRSLKNKLVLRDILKRRLGLDSDALGKLGFSYDTHSVVTSNLNFMLSEIRSCSLWDNMSTSKVLERFLAKSKKSTRAGAVSKNLIYRIYLISVWYNRNEFIN
jgi:asparagine synthase (glutamine-hydrolysing)